MFNQNVKRQIYSTLLLRKHTCWSIIDWLSSDSWVGGSGLWSTGSSESKSQFGAIVTLGCPVEIHKHTLYYTIYYTTIYYIYTIQPKKTTKNISSSGETYAVQMDECAASAYVYKQILYIFYPLSTAFTAMTEWIYRCACVEHLQTSLWQQPWLCQSEPAHPAAAAGQRTPAAVKHITVTSSKNF